MKKRNKKSETYKVILVIVFFIFVLTLICGAYLLNVTNSNSSIYFSSYNKELSNELNDQLDYQEEIDEKIYDILKNGGYTFEGPCVLNNPYNISPLTSLIIFKTEDETSIKVTINDKEVTTMESSREHVIPIYGLYSNATNIITLTNDDGETSEIEIKTDYLNEYVYDEELSPNKDENTYNMLLGGLDSEVSYLRGFDNNMNLVYYLKFGFIDSIDYEDDYISIGYKNAKSDLSSIRLDIDYLGRILNITNNTKKLSDKSNITIGSNNYMLDTVSFYESKTSNYSLTTLTKNDKYTTGVEVSITSVSEKLVDAPTYESDYLFDVNGSYISYEFDGDVTLLMISKKDSSVISYEVSDSGTINVDLSGYYSLYMIKDGVYYTLLTTIEI